MKNLFNRTVHDTCREIHGYIGHFKLSEWWLCSFDEEERQYIELTFTPLGFLARRVIEQAEAIASDPLERHDVFQVMVVVNYRDRKKHPMFLDAAIRACQKQIDIAPEVIRLWRRQRRRRVPTHNGFEQLAIIREKLGDYAAAIRLSQEAMKQGWRGADWEGRIHRCKRKAAKRDGRPVW